MCNYTSTYIKSATTVLYSNFFRNQVLIVVYTPTGTQSGGDMIAHPYIVLWLWEIFTSTRNFIMRDCTVQKINYWFVMTLFYPTPCLSGRD